MSEPLLPGPWKDTLDRKDALTWLYELEVLQRTNGTLSTRLARIESGEAPLAPDGGAAAEIMGLHRAIDQLGVQTFGHIREGIVAAHEKPELVRGALQAGEIPAEQLARFAQDLYRRYATLVSETKRSSPDTNPKPVETTAKEE